MERRWKVLAVVSVAAFLASLDLFIVNIAFPDIGRDFDGAGEASLSWVLNAYAIVFAALLVPAGRLADRYGRRRGFLAGVTVFLVGSALCGIAPSLEVLVGARVVQAAGAAFLTPTSLALLLPEFPPQRRAVAIGIWAAVGGVAAAFGPPLGGVLVEVSWRLVFLVNLPIGLGAIVVAARVLREHRNDAQAVPDLIGTGVLAAAIALLALGLVEAPRWGWGDPATPACLAGAAAGLAWFWVRCHHHPAPVIDPAMLRVRSFALANLAMLLFMTAFAAMLLGLVLYLTQVWGDSVLVAGLSVAPGPVMAAALAVPAGHLGQRLGQGRVAAAGCLLLAAGFAWWSWRIGPQANFAGDLLPAMLTSGIGVGLTLAPLSSAATASLPPDRFATGSAVLTMSRQVGSVLGVSLLIAVIGVPPDFDAAWTLMLVAALLGAGAAAAIGPVVHHGAAAGEAAAAPAVAG